MDNINAYELNKISVLASGKMILSIPHLKIRSGLKVAIVGPSGSGKTTFLRMLNFLQSPKDGDLYFFHRKMTPHSLSAKKRLEIQRKMAFVFQKPVMFDTSVFNNVAIGLKFRGWSKSDISEKVTWALNLVGLEAYIQRHASTLSGGEAQRIALARSIATQPEVLLLDEATANLDPANVRIFEDVIHRLHEHTNMTILIVTHNLAQAERIANECIFICNGKVVETAHTEAFFKHPKSPQLQDFLQGRMIY
jgi:tungstate transport system ATP-binding protein